MTVPASVRAEVFKRDGNRCRYCLTLGYMTLDHVLRPRDCEALGIDYDGAENLVAAHSRCNQRKYTTKRLPQFWKGARPKGYSIYQPPHKVRRLCVGCHKTIADCVHGSRCAA